MRKSIGIASIVFLVTASLAPAWAAPVLAPGGHARFTVICPEAIRMEYSPSGKFVDEPSLFANQRITKLSDDEAHALSVRAEGSQLFIDTGRIRLHYVDDGKPFHRTNLRAEIRRAHGSPPAEWWFGREDAGNLGGTRGSLDQIAGPVSVSPGVLSRSGWHYIDDSSKPLIAPDAKTGWVMPRAADTDLTDGFLVGYGLDYKAGLRALTRIGGPVPLPRRYALGAWYSRWWKYTSDDYRELAREFHDHHFPLDMLVMDTDWHQGKQGVFPVGWSGLSWNRKLLPDAEALLRELHAEGLHLTLNDHPFDGIKPDEDTYDEFMRAMGQNPNLGGVLTYDAGSRSYLENILTISHGPREKEGVDFWWLDWSGDERRPFNRQDWLNEAYFRHSEAHGLRGQSFSRWGDWGDHRHPIHFSGDTRINWSVLKFEVPFTAQAGNVGCFYWSHDIGGFIEDSRDPWDSFWNIKHSEMYARWAQFGALSPVLRVHSVNKPWLDRRPWLYGRAAESSLRASFQLRSRLFPYIYSSAWQAHGDSIPLVRPMYLEYPDQEAAYQNPQEYLFGDALLVAPITTPAGFGGKGHQSVWFPPASRWFDWFSGREWKGSTFANVANNLDSFPLFARGGMPILMQPYAERMSASRMETVVIRLYPGVSGQLEQATLYEDDGETQNYLRGIFALTEVEAHQITNGVRLRILPRPSVFSRPARRQYVIEYMTHTPIVQVRSTAGNATIERDPQAGGIDRIVLSPLTSELPITLDLKFY